MSEPIDKDTGDKVPETREYLERTMAELELRLNTLFPKEATATSSESTTPASDNTPQSLSSLSSKKKRKLPPVYIDIVNKAARTILDFDKNYRTWTATDYVDDDALSAKLLGTAHYVTNSAHFGFLKTLARHFVHKAYCNNQKGEELRITLARMFKPRPETKAGDRLTLDPIRKAWRLFLGNVFLGELVNPLVPKQTGSSLQDYNTRIVKAAERIRLVLFGKEDDLVFHYPASNGVDLAVIKLPTLQEIIQNIVNKLADKENQEVTYLRDQLAHYDGYMAGEFEKSPEQDAMHQASSGIIEKYRKGKNLTGPGISDGARGKKRLFSAFHFLSTPSVTTKRALSTPGSASSSDTQQAFSSSSTAPTSASLLSTVLTGGATSSRMPPFSLENDDEEDIEMEQAAAWNYDEPNVVCNGVGGSSSSSSGSSSGNAVEEQQLRSPSRRSVMDFDDAEEEEDDGQADFVTSSHRPSRHAKVTAAATAVTVGKGKSGKSSRQKVQRYADEDSQMFDYSDI